MRKLNMGLMMALAMGLAVPSFSNAYAAGTKSASSKSAKTDDASGAAPMSKDEAQRVAEHNKLRTEIKKVKYPAPKATIVSHVKGIKADDKKWFADTLPDKTYESADDVFSALGWETTPAPAAAK
jgi:hypothetical protein